MYKFIVYKLVNYFGTDVLEIIDNNIDKVYRSLRNKLHAYNIGQIGNYPPGDIIFGSMLFRVGKWLLDFFKSC